MKFHYFEAVNQAPNWGKFAVGRFGPDEWGWMSETKLESGEANPYSVLGQNGWGRDHLFIMDLATGEGAIFRPGGGSARGDLLKTQLWVCVLFEAFLTWLYQQARARGGRLSESDLEALAAGGLVHVDVPPARAGWRRPGLSQEQLDQIKETELLWEHFTGRLAALEAKILQQAEHDPNELAEYRALRTIFEKTTEQIGKEQE